MITEILLITVALVILYGLISSTEKFLTQRPHYSECDARILDHRSRM